jgi:hypothetical protein
MCYFSDHNQDCDLDIEHFDEKLEKFYENDYVWRQVSFDLIFQALKLDESSIFNNTRLKYILAKETLK